MSSVPWPGADWFEQALGFAESDNDYAATQEQLLAMRAASSDPSCKFKLPNGSRSDDDEVTFGSFTTPSVQDLREECTRLQQQVQQPLPPLPAGRPRAVVWYNIVGNVLDLHADPSNAGAIFQAASQFNCLEFPDPQCRPEDGLTGYCYDRTQGPACAIAAAAGTAVRQYLVEVPVTNDDGSTTIMMGQRKQRQINTLQPLLDQMQAWLDDNKAKDNDGPRMLPCTVKNGYAKATTKQLLPWHPWLQQSQNALQLHSLLQVGVQRDTQVTYPHGSHHLVTQVYCAAIPVAYTTATEAAWEPLARIVLNATYEATLLEGIRHYLAKSAAWQQQETQSSSPPPLPPCRIFLTHVGGGVFGNPSAWIYASMAAAHSAVVQQFPGVPLDVYVVHFRATDAAAQQLVQQLNQT